MIQDGHRRTLTMLEDTGAYQEAVGLYRDRVGDVYFRPTAVGFTPISLDPTCRAMLGVGGKDADCTVSELPIDETTLEKKVVRYEAKKETGKRSSEEERLALDLVRQAMNDDFSFGLDGHFLVHQEWRFGTRKKLDILTVEPSRGRLGVIELKGTEATARASSAKKGDAWSQAEEYAMELRRSGAETFEFFQALIRATAIAHDGPKALREVTLDPNSVPATFVAWPGSGFLRRK